MKNYTLTIQTQTQQFSFSDENIADSARAAIGQFEGKRIIHSKTNETPAREVYIPFHAIQFIESTATIVENPDMPDTNCGEEGPAMDCTRVNFGGSSDGEVFDPITEGTTIQMSLSSVNFLFACWLDQTTLVEPTYTCDMASASFRYENDILYFLPEQTGTAHITLDYMGCNVSFTVEVV